jgi:ferredoxin/flavodoxin---NADP+ reductase
MQDEIFDITIIGAGPVGLYALYYAGLRDARAKIIEALDEIGGALKIIYPEKFIFDVAGYSRILARELVAQFEEQARTYNAPIILGQRVVNVKKTDDGIFILGTADAKH